MKKLISILLCAVLLSTFFTVFTVPAVATNAAGVYSMDALYGEVYKLEEGDYIEADGAGGTWYVDKLIFINTPSCHIEFKNINFVTGGDYNDSFIEVNKDNVTLDFYNCTINTGKKDNNGNLINEGNGSVIYIDGDNCVIDGHDSTVFENCKTSGYYGGAICDDGYNNTIIRNITFKDCECAGLGGAIYTEGTNCTVGNCKFSGCTASEGGSNIYSWYEDQVYVGGCTDLSGNIIDSNTCHNCTGFDPVDTYFRKVDRTCVRHPAFPEEGTYIIRSAVDSDYCFDTRYSPVCLKKQGETEFQTFKLERVIDQYRRPTNAYIIHPAYYEYSNNQYGIVVGNKNNIADEVYMRNNFSYGAPMYYWCFEDDAPGDNCYYIHSVNGGWLEAAGCVNGAKPTSGCDVLYTNYTGEQNQMWILERVGAPSGSTISEGNTWIIAGFAAVAVVVIAAVVINNKKKKAKLALADGEGSVTDNTEKTEE